MRNSNGESIETKNTTLQQFHTEGREKIEPLAANFVPTFGMQMATYLSKGDYSVAIIVNFIKTNSNNYFLYN